MTPGCGGMNAWQRFVRQPLANVKFDRDFCGVEMGCRCSERGIGWSMQRLNAGKWPQTRVRITRFPTWELQSRIARLTAGESWQRFRHIVEKLRSPADTTRTNCVHYFGRIENLSAMHQTHILSAEITTKRNPYDRRERDIYRVVWLIRSHVGAWC